MRRVRYPGRLFPDVSRRVFGPLSSFQSGHSMRLILVAPEEKRLYFILVLSVLSKAVTRSCFPFCYCSCCCSISCIFFPSFVCLLHRGLFYGAGWSFMEFILWTLGKVRDKPIASVLKSQRCKKQEKSGRQLPCQAMEVCDRRKQTACSLLSV